MGQVNNSRIAKNAVYLYGRMFLTIGVSLYTNRVVLDVLGESNYGIYNLVGGIVILFGFLNGTFAAATARFLNFELGQNNLKKLRDTFSTAMQLHFCIAALIFILAETVGLWFVNTNLEIAPERMLAANITYQLSIFSSLILVIQIPYTSAIMAREHMGAYAWIAILNTLLKLAITLMLLLVASLDTLIIYAVLMFGVSLTVGLTYMIYCRRHFAECRISTTLHPQIFKSMLSFSGWDLYGNFAYLARVQGTIIILNRFGGTILNAAGNLTLTVSSTISSFAGNVVNAFRPQIIQQYACGNRKGSANLLYNCARYSFLLMGLIVVPMFLEMHQVLGVWLKEVPEFTAVFTRIALIAACGEILITCVGAGIHATGRLILLSFVSGTLYLLELPAMYFVLKATNNPPLIYQVHCAFIVLILFTNTLILKHQMPEFKLTRFWWRSVLVPGTLVLTAAAMAYGAQTLCINPWMKFFATTATSTIALCLLSYCFGIDRNMRAMLNNKIASLLHTKNHG